MRIILISNMYPSVKNPFYGIFVKTIEEGLIEQGVEVIDRIVIDRKLNGIAKIMGYVRFYLFAMFRLLVGPMPDAIYVHYALHSFLPVLLLHKIIKTKIILNVHGTDLRPYGQFLKKMVKRNLDISNLIVAPSSYYKNLLENEFGIEASKIFVSPSGGVNTEFFSAKERNNITTDSFTIGFISRIDEDKGWRIYLDAIRGIILRYPAIKIKGIIIGGGTQEAELISSIAAFDLADIVRFYGSKPHNELPLYLNQMKVFVFPSKRESLGLVGVEAMSCGVPVIGSNIAGIKEYLVDQYNGLSFTAGNAESLLSQLVYFYNLSPEEKAEYSKGASDTASRFDHKKVSKALAERLKGLL